MLGAEPLDLIQFDVSVHRLSHDSGGDPPLSARQSGRQISPGPRLSVLSAAGMSEDFAVPRLPQPDKASLFAEDDSVVPPPDHHLIPVRCNHGRYQVTG